MRVALSTLGCPDLTVSEAAGLAADAGYEGLELRSAPGGTVTVEATGEQRRCWRQQLVSASVQPVAVASYVRLCDPDAAVGAAGLREAQLAHDLGAPWVRVFPGGRRGVPAPASADDRAGRRLADLIARTRELGVGVAVETHDSHPRAADVLRIVDRDGCEAARVIWDVLHTWLGGEDPSTTLELLGDRLAHVQVKDVGSRDDLAPLPLGEGVLPLRECVRALVERGCPEWVSWEYERMWHPEATALEEVAGPGHRFLAEAFGLAG